MLQHVPHSLQHSAPYLFSLCLYLVFYLLYRPHESPTKRCTHSCSYKSPELSLEEVCLSPEIVNTDEEDCVYALAP